MGFEGVYFTRTCYPDVNANLYNLLLKTGNIREFWGTSILPVSLDSICGVNGFQQGSNSFCGLGKNICIMHQSFVSPAPMGPGDRDTAGLCAGLYPPMSAGD